MPTTEELLNLPYETNPHQKGFVTKDYKAEYEKHGQRVRWWKGYKAPDGAVGPNGETVGQDGILKIEQALDPEVRALFSQTRREVLDAEFGKLPIGQTQLSVLPRWQPDQPEMVLARNDRILGVEQELVRRCIIKPSGEVVDDQQIDVLPFRFVQHITAVIGASGPMPEDYYSVGEGDQGAIVWNQGAPAYEVAVELIVAPLYIFLDTSDRHAFRGADWAKLPQIGILLLDKE